MPSCALGLQLYGSREHWALSRFRDVPRSLSNRHQCLRPQSRADTACPHTLCDRYHEILCPVTRNTGCPGFCTMGRCVHGHSPDSLTGLTMVLNGIQMLHNSASEQGHSAYRWKLGEYQSLAPRLGLGLRLVSFSPVVRY